MVQYRISEAVRFLCFFTKVKFLEAIDTYSLVSVGNFET